MYYTRGNLSTKNTRTRYDWERTSPYDILITYMEPTNLFDYRDFAHKDLFKNGSNIWSSIERLDSYLKMVTKGTVLIGKNTTIHKTANIEGGVIIGNNVDIKDGALIRNGAVIGNNVVIGHVTEIKHSIILNGAHIPHLNYVGDSIIGNNVNLGAGVILANYKAGSKYLEVSVVSNGSKLPTGMKKLGCFIGDGVKIGSNTVCDPGTIIGKNSVIYPLSLIRGYIPANKIVKNKSNLVITEKK